MPILFHTRPEPNQGARGQEHVAVQQPVFIPMNPSSFLANTPGSESCNDAGQRTSREAFYGEATGAQVTIGVGAEVGSVDLGDRVVKLNHSRTAAAGN